jgi:hypothetical protein
LKGNQTLKRKYPEWKTHSHLLDSFFPRMLNNQFISPYFPCFWRVLFFVHFSLFVGLFSTF